MWRPGVLASGGRTVRIEQLRIQGLRCLTDVEISPCPLINVFIGANGAGKTSVLEAAFLLSHARSFRNGAREALLQRGASRLSVFAELKQGNEQVSRLGLGREASRWGAKLDGEAVTLGRMVQECAVVCFEPGSHALIAGSAEERRRYLDWGVFHVEHEFAPAWRRYQRALKQRNALLRIARDTDDSQFTPWEQELDQSARLMDDQRQRYLELLRPKLLKSASGLLPELGSVELRYRRGWSHEMDLAQQLRMSRDKDISRGHTTSGAHRADWTLSYENAPSRDHLSRGQEKLTALACMLAQAELFAECRGEWPVVCLDDLASELDLDHQAAVVSQLVAAQAQVLLTGTEPPVALRASEAKVFHVEQGHLSRLL
jgi:DNA replication and repair protein RecF